MLAIKSFSMAAERAVNPGQMILAKEELARLHRRRDELGLAMKYTEEVINHYIDGLQAPQGRGCTSTKPRFC